MKLKHVIITVILIVQIAGLVFDGVNGWLAAIGVLSIVAVNWIVVAAILKSD